MDKLFRRPSVVTLSSMEETWPDKAIATLHEGFKVEMCRSQEYIFARLPRPQYSIEAETNPDPPILETIVHLDVLNRTYEIPFHASELRELLQTAELMNRSLAVMNPERIVIRMGSYQWVRTMLFYPRWAWKSSGLFWLRRLFHRRDVWLRMTGRAYSTRPCISLRRGSNQRGGNSRWITIAEWAGWKKKDRPATPPIQWTDDDFVIGGVAYWDKPPPYDTELAFWHGEDGLLAKISEKGKVFVNSFLRCYFDGLFGEGCWQWDFNPHSTDEGPMALLTIMDSAPAQLAEALVKVIKEG